MGKLISIIVPIYKVEKYLDKCINSIVNQTYRHLEIILVDDGSPDKCGNICDEYAKRDKRIIVIHKENGGLSDARNAGLDIATGNYITCIDSDDYVSIDYIEYLYNLIEKSKADVSVCNMKLIFQDKKTDYRIISDYEKIFTPEEAIKTMLYQSDFDNSAWGKLFKSNLFKDIRFPKNKLFEDFAIMYKLISNTRKIIYGSKQKYFYIIREDSIMKKEFNLKKMDLINFSKDMVKYVTNKYPNLKKAAIRRDTISNIQILCQLIHCKPSYIQQEKELIKNIRRNAKTVLIDKNADRKEKLATICVLLGRRFFKTSWSIYMKKKS